MKLVDTPFGKMIMPVSFERDIEVMSNEELIEKLIEDERETGFIEPFKLQFVIDRGLYCEYIKVRDK